MFVGAAADQGGDQVGLYRRAAGAFDVQDDRLAARGAERAVDQRRHGTGTDRAGTRRDQAVHLDHIDARAAPGEETAQHRIGLRGGEATVKGGGTFGRRKTHASSRQREPLAGKFLLRHRDGEPVSEAGRRSGNGDRG